MTPGRRKKHKPEEIIAKLRDADTMLNAGKDLAAVLQALEISEATLVLWRALHDACRGTAGPVEPWVEMVPPGVNYP
jgi:hypothetical protein